MSAWGAVREGSGGTILAMGEPQAEHRPLRIRRPFLITSSTALAMARLRLQSVQ